MMSRDLLSSQFGRWVAIEKLECRTLLSAGALDNTFGMAGQVTLSGSTPLAFNREPLGVQSDGKVVIAVGGSQTQIERLNTDGSLDNTFGSHGVVSSPVVGVNAIAIESDGEIVLGGYQSISSGVAQFALARLNVDGSLDSSFGASGTVASPIDGYVGVQSLAVGADGKIVAAGVELPAPSGPASYSFNVARYNANGTLDTSFNGTGEVSKLIDHAGDFNDAPATAALAVQPNGKILVGAASNADLAIWRFNADGAADASFGTAGQVTTPVTYTGETNQTLGTDAAVTNLLVQPNGQVLAGGTIVSPASDDLSMLVVRYNPDGTLATGPALVSPPQFGYETEQPAGMALQADGKIVLGWYLPTQSSATQPSAPGPQFTFDAERLNSDFSTDSTFALPSGTTVPVNTLAMASDGRIVVAGATSQSSSVIVSRLLNDAPADTGGGSGTGNNGGGSSGSGGSGSGGTGTNNGTGNNNGNGGSNNNPGGGSNSGGTGGTGTGVGTTPNQQPLPPGQLTAVFATATPELATPGAKAAAAIRVTNAGNTTFSGPVSIAIYATANGTVSAGDEPIAALSLHRLNLRAGSSKSLKLKFNYPATLPAGSWILVAAVTETAAKTAPALAIRPGAVSMLETTADLAVLASSAPLLLTPGHPATAFVSIENLGNAFTTGSVTITLTAAPNAGGPTTTLAVLTRAVRLKPKGKLRIPADFVAPATLTPGSYRVVKSIASSTQPADSNPLNDSAIVGTAAK
jgi:uncharacterized delta-60 repeat protein